jgi:hypothetical protein
VNTNAGTTELRGCGKTEKSAWVVREEERRGKLSRTKGQLGCLVTGFCLGGCYVIDWQRSFSHLFEKLWLYRDSDAAQHVIHMHKVRVRLKMHYAQPASLAFRGKRNPTLQEDDRIKNNNASKEMSAVNLYTKSSFQRKITCLTDQME